MSGTGLGPAELPRPTWDLQVPPTRASAPPSPVAEGEKRWSEQLAWSGRTATPQDFPVLGVLAEGHP